jgi:hypothetical protein
VGKNAQFYISTILVVSEQLFCDNLSILADIVLKLFPHLAIARDANPSILWIGYIPGGQRVGDCLHSFHHASALFSMPKVPQTALLIATGVALVATSATLTAVVLRLRSPQMVLNPANLGQVSQLETICTTIVTDPNPPLNVRSSPVVAPDNIVGKVKNGTTLTVVNQNQGWLRISSPIAGWVYQDRTVTSCVPAMEGKPLADLVAANDEGSKTLAEATEYYHTGHLDAAVALARTILPDSPAYAPARVAIAHWQEDWRRSENEFYSAQRDLRDGRWQDVLNRVKDFPDNRYWREKLTPMVREAAERKTAIAKK